LFEAGRYLPLAVEGTCRDHVCAFERSVNDSSILVVVPRFCSRLIRDSDGLPLGQEVWQDTRIIQPFDSAASRYRNIFTGEELGLDQKDGQLSLALRNILAVYPVALLERLDDTPA
jgi:(1->4)-alpha-D-glucan 1-alpha-D-glucosylmutase